MKSGNLATKSVFEIGEVAISMFPNNRASLVFFYDNANVMSSAIMEPLMFPLQGKKVFLKPWNFFRSEKLREAKIMKNSVELKNCDGKTKIYEPESYLYFNEAGLVCQI